VVESTNVETLDKESQLYREREGKKVTERRESLESWNLQADWKLKQELMLWS
jgi:hypothetical protein